MKNAIRCCISCILPCGALDVIRIVHSNGHVEEISGTIKAADIMRAHPKHVLKKPSSPPPDEYHDVISTTIVAVPPDSELRRGKIYFLIPVAGKPHRRRRDGEKKRRDGGGSIPRHNQQQQQHNRGQIIHQNQHESIDRRNRRDRNINVNSNLENNLSVLSSDRYLSEILSEKISTQRDLRRGRSRVWRPHLESITEASSIEG